MLPVLPRFRFALLAAACVLSLAGCAGSVQPEIKRLPERVELNGRFYRGEAYQSGPQTLASLLFQQGVVITPGLLDKPCLLYTSPSPRDRTRSRMPSSA